VNAADQGAAAKALAEQARQRQAAIQEAQRKAEEARRQAEALRAQQNRGNKG
jgi:hypothetical protein